MNNSFHAQDKPELISFFIRGVLISLLILAFFLLSGISILFLTRPPVLDLSKCPLTYCDGTNKYYNAGGFCLPCNLD
jgi:hypothetical protein